jgi:hypothetical protein
MPDVEFATVLAKKLSMLEQLVLSGGEINEAFLIALANHCPRLQLLHADSCCIWYPIGGTLRASMESKIKDLRLPYMVAPSWPRVRWVSRSLDGTFGHELPKPDGL